MSATLVRQANSSPDSGGEPPNQGFHLTGAAIMVSRDINLLQRPWQMNLVIRRRTMA